MKMNHVMLDLETMGICPDSAIVSIGAVVFDPRVNKVTDKTFYTELDWESQGRCIDTNTELWWQDQSAKARDALDGLDDLQEQLRKLAVWLPRDCKVWGNGAIFDIGILENAYIQYEIDIPWQFWNIRDMRTIKDLYESQRGGFSKKPGGAAHNALEDAIAQAHSINMMWNKILAKG